MKLRKKVNDKHRIIHEVPVFVGDSSLAGFYPRGLINEESGSYRMSKLVHVHEKIDLKSR